MTLALAEVVGNISNVVMVANTEVKPIKIKGSDKMLALEELKRTLLPYKAKLIEMGDSL